MTLLRRYDEDTTNRTAETVARNARYHTNTEAVPDSVRKRAGRELAQLSSITSEESFQKYFYHAMAETRREDLARNYSRLSATERSIFVTALANRGVLDKQKKKSRSSKRTHVEEDIRTVMLQEMSGALSMKNSTVAEGARTVAPEVYSLAARAMLTAQISDKDGGALSKRSSLYDLKLVNRAFKFLWEANQLADKQDAEAYKTSAQEFEKIQGGYADEGSVRFHKKATHGEKLQAAAVSNMEQFTEFYQELRKEGSKNIAAFQAFDETEKKLFVWALAHPGDVAKSVGPLRHNARHNDGKRQAAKNEFAQNAGRTVDAQDFRRAAMMLLSTEGRYYKTKGGYNQPIVRDAMHFVRAAQMVRVDKLRQKHEEAAKQDRNLSGDTKWSATNAIDVARGKMRIDADEVKSLEDFEKFLEKGIKLSGDKYASLLEQYQALDQRSKVLFVQGLSRRTTTEGITDRSRVRLIQAIGNKVSKYGVKDMGAREEMVLKYIADKKKHENGEESEAFRAEMVASQLGSDGKVISQGDAWRAAVNLVSKDTQALWGQTGVYIDVGMVQRGLNLVRFAEKRLRKNETIDVAANPATGTAEQKGYRTEAEDLRRQFAEGSAAHKAKIAAHTQDQKYRAVSTASRQNVHDARGVSDMASFREFFGGLMEQDDNASQLTKFDAMTDEEKWLFIRALAHRDVLDRNRDKALLTRYLRLWDLHGYQGRETRDKMKNEFAQAGMKSEQPGATPVSVAEPTAAEFKAAAFSIISRETRRANWFSKVTHQKAGDDRLLDRAFKLISVAREKREKANDEIRNEFMKAQGQEGGEDEITRRATEEVKLLADAAQDVASFDQFMAKAVGLKYMKKYAALSESDKHLFVLALANRRTLDRRDKKTREDQNKRDLLTIYAILGKSKVEKAEAQAKDFRLAAYNLLGSKGRALGTRRFLGIKFGAANTEMLDRAFRLIKETDAKRDEVTKPKDREVIMNQFGVSKLTHKARQPVRQVADQIQDLKGFTDFFHAQMLEKQKEKFIFTYSTYSTELKNIFVNAVARYTPGLIKMPIEQQRLELAKPVDARTYRAAAYRLLEHIKGNSPALHYAQDMVDDHVQFRFEQQKNAADGKKTMKEYLDSSGLMEKSRLPMWSEFDSQTLIVHNTQNTKSSWLERKGFEVFSGMSRSMGESVDRMHDSVDTRLDNMNHTGFKYGATRFFTRTLNLAYRKRKKIDRAAEAERAQAIENTREGFLRYLFEHARRESRVSLFNAIKALSGPDLELFIAALNDRTVLDESYEEGNAYESQNEEGRSALLTQYIQGTVTLGENAYRNAALALNSSRVIGKSRVSTELDKKESRSTVVDWRLIEEGLAFVQFVAQDEKRMHQVRARDQRGEQDSPEVGAFRSTEVKEGFDLSGPKALFSTGNSVYSVYKKSKQIHEGVEMVKDSTLQDIRDMGVNLQKAPGAIQELFNDLSIDKIQETIQRFQDAEVFSALAGSASAIKSLVTNSVGLVKNSVGLGKESAQMHRLQGQSADFEKQMTLEEKLDIVQESLADAFKMAKEMQAKDVSGKVFDILENICALVTTGLSLAGIPQPVTSLINTVVGLVLKGAKWITNKIIALVQGSRVDELLQVKKKTHLYNQRIKAYNSRPDRKGKPQRDLMTEGQMKKMLIRQSGLRSEKGALDYICRKTANCLIYAYGDKDQKSTNRIAAAQLFAGLKVPFTPGSNPPQTQDLVMKLRGAH